MIMKAARVFTVLLAVSMSATADGSTWRSSEAQRRDQPKPAHDRFIVEFREAPAVRRAGLKSAAHYAETFTRFRADVAGIAKSSTGTVTHEYFRVFHGAAATLPEEVIARVRQLPYVAAVHPDVEVEAYQSPGDTGVVSGGTGDSIAQVGAKTLWATRGVRGRGIVVAVLDTGIDYRHPALGAGFGPGSKVIGGWDFVNNDADPIDDQYHGTHVAGIIAAQSAEFSGVAPEASLIAFKVLNDKGRGQTSNVLAAIERALDPNNDGDLSDRVDVANISLGSYGNPDDVLSRAVDNGSAAGVVFCVAAGNYGDFLTIGSPGTARTAITVGNAYGTSELSVMSSKGPNTRALTIKPEVIAPGEEIRSTLPSGRYGELSGTSMATPHVAGLAALLLEANPGLLPTEVRSALMTTARSIGIGPMEEGAGFVDGMRAVAATVVASPAQISFGLGDVSATQWTRRQTIRLINATSNPQTLTLSAPSLPAGVQMAIDPAQVTLGPSGIQEVSFTVTVTNANATVTRSFTVGGSVIIEGGAQTVRIPWAAVKAARATVTSDVAFTDTAWLGEEGWIGLYAQVDENTRETLLPSGRYDLLAASLVRNQAAPIGDTLRVFFRDHESIDGDRTVHLSADGTPHRIEFAGRDHRGERLTERAERTDLADGAYLSQLRISLEGSFIGMTMEGGITTVEMSGATDRWAAYGFETFVDLAKNEVYTVAHAPLRGISESRELSRGANDLVPVTLKLRPVLGDPLADVAIIPWIVKQGSYSSPLNVIDPANDGSWDVKLYQTEAYDAFIAGVVFHARSVGGGDLDVEPLHVRNGRVVSTYTPASGRGLYEAEPGETLTFGAGPYFPSFKPGLVGPNKTFFATGAYTGQTSERRHRDIRRATVTMREAAGALIYSGNYLGGVQQLTARPDKAYVIELLNTNNNLGGIPMRGVLTYRFDMRRADVVPPALTSFRVVDASGRARDRVAAGSQTSLLFSAGDYVLSDNVQTYQRIRPEATKVWWRRNGTTAWQSIEPQVLEEDASGPRPDGFLYRADLSTATEGPGGMIDLRVEITDEAGNTTDWTLSPAFSTGEITRRRAVRAG